MDTTVIYNEQTKEVLGVGYGGTWVLPCGVGVRGYHGNDEPVFVEVGGRIFLKENALITKIEL